jgi:hypothetical protein
MLFEMMDLVEEELCWTEKGVLETVARSEQTTQLTGDSFASFRLGLFSTPFVVFPIFTSITTSLCFFV